MLLNILSLIVASILIGTVNYLHHLIAQNHRLVKRRNKFYRSLRATSITIKGMEAIRGIHTKRPKRRNALRLFQYT